MLTGGEPLLNPDNVINIIKYIRGVKSNQKIYLYTAKSDDWVEFIRVARELNGLTLTLHEPKDYMSFVMLDRLMYEDPGAWESKSFRLHVFAEVNEFVESDSLCCDWQVRNNMEWIKHCPLPKGEVFKRL